MKKAADLLCILTCFSIRSDFFTKAHQYAEIGHKLFPSDIRFVELYGYILILSEKFAEAEELLSQHDNLTVNIAYLKARNATMVENTDQEKRRKINDFLTYWHQAG